MQREGERNYSLLAGHHCCSFDDPVTPPGDRRLLQLQTLALERPLIILYTSLQLGFELPSSGLLRASDHPQRRDAFGNEDKPNLTLIVIYIIIGQ